MGAAANSTAMLSTTTGLELAIPLNEIGYAGGLIYVLVDIAGTSDSGLSNQSLPGQPPGSPNYPSLPFNYSSKSGEFFTVDSASASPFTHWQTHYFGSTDNPNAAPGVDYYGTGMSNTNKFMAGFSGSNPAAYPHIISLARQGADMNVTYLGANGDSTWSPGIALRTNILEYSTGAANGSYNGTFLPVPSAGTTNILSGGTGIGIITNMVDAGGATNTPSRYYRVRVLLP